MSKFVEMSSLIDEISMGPFGSDIKVEYFVDKGFPVLNGSNLSSIKLVENDLKFVTIEKALSLKKAIASRGDIVITHRGTLGQISFIHQKSRFSEYLISQSQFRLRLKKDLADPEYIVYYFHSAEGQKRLLANKNYVGVPALAQATTNFRKVAIPLPELWEQKVIAKVLSTLDDKIELNNKICSELESLAQDLYHFWFTQFDFPDEDGKPYRSSGGKMVWNDELGREIPEGWRFMPLTAIGEIAGGATPSRKNSEFYQENGIPWITPKDMSETNEKYILRGKTNISELGLRCSSAKLLPTGTVLLTSRAPIGYLGIANNPLSTNQGFKSIVPKKEYGSEFVYFLLKDMVPSLRTMGAKSTFQEVSKTVLEGTKVLVPDAIIVSLFKEAVAPYSDMRRSCEAETRELAKLRDFLLPLLMNGQVSVCG